jgi:50S ribosomal subunit-associated GTPase HflX
MSLWVPLRIKRDTGQTYYIGRGRRRIEKSYRRNGRGTVIFDNGLTGSQFNNLEDFLGVDVIDRATLNFRFSQSTRQHEGKLQVDFAIKKHNMPRAMNERLHSAVRAAEERRRRRTPWRRRADA